MFYRGVDEIAIRIQLNYTKQYVTKIKNYFQTKRKGQIT